MTPVLKKLLTLLRRRPERRAGAESPAQTNERSDDSFSADLDTNLERLRTLFVTSSDVVYRRFDVPGRADIKAALVFVEGLVDPVAIDQEVLGPLLTYAKEAKEAERITQANIVRIARQAVLTASEIKEARSLHDAALQVLRGVALLLFDGNDTGLLVDIRKWQERAVEQPVAQSIIRGPRDGFTENLHVNVVLVRRRIRDPNFSVEMMQIGRRSQTDVAVLYIRDIADPDIVREVKSRLQRIDVDAILESGYVEHLIEDNWWTVFPTVQDTERPDQVAGGLLEGRVAIIVDNTPFALLVPVTVSMFLSSPEDMYFRWLIATLLRILRYVAAFASLVLPSMYVALTSYHPGMLPTNLALFVAATREAVPFPAFFEALMMEVTLEVLREAGLRLPGPIGQTIGIVGAIIIGDAAVNAGLVSPIMVVAVAATAIASFVIPTYSFAVALRILRFGLLFCAGVGGLFGVMIGLLLILGHLSMLSSFGVPYLAPFAPASLSDWRDTWLRFPRVSMHRRPGFLKPQDADRMDDKRVEDDPARARRRGR